MPLKNHCFDPAAEQCQETTAKLESSIFPAAMCPKEGGNAAGDVVPEPRPSRTHAGHAPRAGAMGSFLPAKWSVSQLSAGHSSLSLQREGSGSPDGSLARHDGLLGQTDCSCCVNAIENERDTNTPVINEPGMGKSTRKPGQRYQPHKKYGKNSPLI